MAFQLRTLELVADSVIQVSGGWAIRTPSLPDVWSLNYIRLAKPVPHSKALEIADEHLSDLTYRHVVLEHPQLDCTRLDPLLGEGFTTDREVVMAIAPGDMMAMSRGDAMAITPDAADAISPFVEPRATVTELDEQAMLELVERWVSDDHRVSSLEVTHQLVEASRREGRGWHERRFGIAADDGEPKAITKLRSDGRTAQVEDVYTVPDARNRGFARTLVAHAVDVARGAGHEVIFIVADDNDWPKHLYASLGFRPIGFHLIFHRKR